MLPRFIAKGAIDSIWQYDFDSRGWIAQHHLEPAPEFKQTVEQTIVYTGDPIPITGVDLFVEAPTQPAPKRHPLRRV